MIMKYKTFYKSALKVTFKQLLKKKCWFTNLFSNHFLKLDSVLRKLVNSKMKNNIPFSVIRTDNY